MLSHVARRCQRQRLLGHLTAAPAAVATDRLHSCLLGQASLQALRFFNQQTPPGHPGVKIRPSEEGKKPNKPRAPALVMAGFLLCLIFWWAPLFLGSVAIGSVTGENQTLDSRMVGGMGGRGDEQREKMKQEFAERKARLAREQAAKSQE
eukprot:TRINITY_DN36423_c0_g1_i1.p2 TRINITY_DN36423_c0_g1~~TRINITY_DN36423_c0_g1_i1.p2  ORF type:complete len:159 (+),score=34.82 TRINITY_DN36423_c0_g1_i1:29-478(+)